MRARRICAAQHGQGAAVPADALEDDRWTPRHRSFSYLLSDTMCCWFPVGAVINLALWA